MTAPNVLPCARVKIGHSVGFLTLAGPVYTIRDESGYTFTFEWHPYFGPARCNGKGDVVADSWPVNSKFWVLFQRWMNAGKRIDQLNRCILGPPIPPCDASCPDCGGRGWYRWEGERTKVPCLGVQYQRIELKPLAGTRPEAG